MYTKYLARILSQWNKNWRLYKYPQLIFQTDVFLRLSSENFIWTLCLQFFHITLLTLLHNISNNIVKDNNVIAVVELCRKRFTRWENQWYIDRWYMWLYQCMWLIYRYICGCMKLNRNIYWLSMVHSLLGFFGFDRAQSSFWS